MHYAVELKALPKRYPLHIYQYLSVFIDIVYM